MKGEQAHNQREGQKSWECIICLRLRRSEGRRSYPCRTHFIDQPLAYNEKADKESWGEMQALFRRAFKK